MATYLVTDRAVPDHMELTTGLTLRSSPDAVEGLETVQGISTSNNHLVIGTVDGRSVTPSPEASPVPNANGDDKRDTHGTRARVATHSTTKDMSVATGPKVEHIHANILTEIAHRFSQLELRRGLDFSVVDNERRCTADLATTNMELNGNNAKGNSSRTSSPNSAFPASDQNRLLRLAEVITLNISSQAAADDGARIKVATAALELAAAVRTPTDTVMDWFATMSVISSVRLFLHWGAFDMIPSGEGESITYAELAERVNADEGLVVRVASMLTSCHVLAHHLGSRDRPVPCLSHTPTSLLLFSGQPMAAMFSLMYTNVAHVSTILPTYFDLYGRTEPLGPAHIPTSYLAGHPEEDYFSLLKKDETALRDFNLAMRISSRRVPVTGMYDMSSVLQAARDGRETVWVDIGGGDGHTVKEFLTAYPGLRSEQCVVQDLDEVVVAAREQHDPELRGVRWMKMDFLHDAPLKGALVYYLRHILRDYSDPVATTILSNVARALTHPDSRVLISEQLNPDMASMPDPLPLYAAFKDFSMLSIGGKERSLQQFEKVADAAGLKVSAVFRDRTTPHAVIELALK
ncbi:S-adenosyl-L-methionine-dependent methyltransferase [Achaetomium macrosporum]|uniref:S-adenosyl-L-methionine-dependent methyltransferase n=1 Tax=Achaetomium macrosporum TaxID=79813 RepID=A0AAN7C4E8_9PEZI|nr:S-adenosyl-L-methionine-dependent methyltransferase [Achaetomium macrosporum]